MDDADLSGLDLAGAKAYIFEFAASAKALAKELSALEAELGTWRGRVGLAEGKGLAELAEAARKRAAELEAKVGQLAGEKAELEATIARMREKLPGIAARERSVDADLLLAELQLMTGSLLGDSAGGGAVSGGAASGGQNVEAEFGKLEAASSLDAALESLKKKARGES